MKPIRNLLACIVLLGGYASTHLPALTPESSAPDPLKGVWRGEFTSSTPGHSGVLHLNIKSGTGGDALMIADDWTQNGSGYFNPPPTTIQQPELLFVSIARSGANDIQITTHQYRDLVCGCELRMIFSGSLKWDAMDGTFRATGADGNVRFEGTWSVRRLTDADPRIDGNNPVAVRKNGIEVELLDLRQLDS